MCHFLWGWRQAGPSPLSHRGASVKLVTTCILAYTRSFLSWFSGPFLCLSSPPSLFSPVHVSSVIPSPIRAHIGELFSSHCLIIVLLCSCTPYPCIHQLLSLCYISLHVHWWLFFRLRVNVYCSLWGRIEGNAKTVSFCPGTDKLPVRHISYSSIKWQWLLDLVAWIRCFPVMHVRAYSIVGKTWNLVSESGFKLLVSTNCTILEK